VNEVTYCHRHPLTETNLRCTKCDVAICPNCMVHAPVGIRCPDCARSMVIPTFDIRGQYKVRAVLVGVVFGIGGGFFWATLSSTPFLSVFAWLILAGVGYANGELISRFTNRKRGQFLQITTAGSVLLSYAVGVFLIGPSAGSNVFGWVALVIAIYIGMGRVK